MNVLASIVIARRVRYPMIMVTKPMITLTSPNARASEVLSETAERRLVVAGSGSAMGLRRGKGDRIASPISARQALVGK